ncbi:hypothetical protein PILCRDRAFT_2012, partial [Piloderma croceum F 1598]
MYLPLINAGYILFTACMTLAGMLASDPEGALFFVSTLPLPFASSVTLLAPALVQLRLEFVLRPLELTEISNAPLSKLLRLASHVSSQPAGLSEDIWHRLRPDAPLGILPAHRDWNSDTLPIPADYLWSEPSSSSTPLVKAEPQSGFKNTFATTGDKSMSLAVPTLIQSQSTRLPAFMMPALLFFGALFVVRTAQRIACLLLLRWNIDADYDPDLEQDNPCKVDEFQPDNTSCSRTVVADTINTSISVSSTGDSATLEAVLLFAHAKCNSTNQDLATLVDETSAMTTQGTSSHVQSLLHGNISPIVPSALPYANTLFSHRLGLDVEEHQDLGRTLNISYDSASDGPSPSHTRLVNGTFADHSVSAVIPTGRTPPTKTHLFSSKPIGSIQDDLTVIYETSFEFTSDAQYHFATKPTPKDSSFPVSLDSDDVLVRLRSVDALAQGQHSRMSTSNIEPSTDQVVKHITCNAFSIERRDPSIGPAINISRPSEPFTNDHTFDGQAQVFNMDDLIPTTSGMSQDLKTKPYLSVTETPICPETRSHPVGVVLVQFQDPSSGQAISIPLGSDSIDRGAITIDAQGATAVANSPTRRKRSKPTKNQRMARNAARVYDIVLPFDDVDDLTDLFSRVK